MEEIMNLTVGQIAGRIAGILAVLSVFVEITPIQINPVSFILEWIGRKTSKDVLDKVDELGGEVKELTTKVNKIEASEDEREAITRRVRILRFGDELRMNQHHSQEGFDQVMDDIDFYESYCAAHPDFKNNKTKITTQIIKDAYQKCIDDNDFL